MTEAQIKARLNPDDDAETNYRIDAAIDFAKEWTGNSFKVGSETNYPPAISEAVRLLVEGFDQPSNVGSEGVAGELNVSYFSADATASAVPYMMPFRKVRW